MAVYFYVIIIRVRKRGLKNSIFWMILICVCVLMSGCGNKQIVLTTGFAQDELFRVEETHCSKAEVMVYLYNLHSQYERAYGREIWTAGGEDESLDKDLKQTALARIAKVKLMNILAERYQVVLGSADVMKAQQAADMYFSSLSEAELELFGNLTKELTQKMYEEYAVADKLYDKLTEGVVTEISDDEARVVKLHRIVLLKQKTLDDGSVQEYDADELKLKAEDIIKRLEEGEDFDTIAYSVSDAKEISVDMVKGEEATDVEELCFALAEGEVGAPLVKNDGVYIYKCISTFDRQQIEERKIRLAKQREKEAFDAKYNEFASGMEIYLNEDLWNTIELGSVTGPAETDFFEIYNRFFEK